jgi:imidazolonepropionase-like amidohydrolase
VTRTLLTGGRVFDGTGAAPGDADVLVEDGRILQVGPGLDGHAHFRDDELTALVAEAAAAGRWVMAHAQASDGIKAAVRAGIRSVEHGIYLEDAGDPFELATLGDRIAAVVKDGRLVAGHV